MKKSSLQGIVRPPIGWSNPNSSSALPSSSWNEGWFRSDTGTTNRFFSLSPTYIARWPFGTSINLEAALFANEFDLRRMFLAFITPGKRMAIAICPERWWGSQMKREKKVKDLRAEYVRGLGLDMEWYVYVLCIYKHLKYLKCGVNGVEAFWWGFAQKHKHLKDHMELSSNSSSRTCQWLRLHMFSGKSFGQAVLVEQPARAQFNQR